MKPAYVAQYETLEKKHWWWLARRRIVCSTLERLPIQKSSAQRPKLLDIGCGAGFNLVPLLPKFDCLGLEPDPVLAQAAQANTGLPIRNFDLSEAGRLGEHQFDCALLLDVIEHIDDDLKALVQTKRLLSPGGHLLINVPALPQLWSVHDEANGHKRRYLKRGLGAVIEKAGFELLSLDYWGGLLVPIAYAERLSKRRVSPEHYLVPLPPAWVNLILEGLVVREYLWTKGLRLPWGLSLLAAAREK